MGDDRRRYGNREDEPCGSWRPLTPGRSTPRAVCTRRWHPGQVVHHSADRKWWWVRDDRRVYRAHENVIPTPDNDPRRANNPDRANDHAKDIMTETTPGRATRHATGKSLADMTAELRTLNIEKGHRPAGGGPGVNTWGDYIALLHSEIGEATDAYRTWRLEDPTGRHVPADRSIDGPPKPEGVGSELADVLIRLLDTCDVFGIRAFEMDLELDDVADLDSVFTDDLISFGDWMSELHDGVAALRRTAPRNRATATAPGLLQTLVTTARHFGFDLAAEYERKVRFNRGRDYQHGGRTMADGKVGS